MLLNKLEQLASYADRLAEDAADVTEVKRQSEQLNERLETLMQELANRQQQLAARLSARKQLQTAIGFDKDMSLGARKMFAADQQAFYQQLLGEMFQFFTGSDQGRCMSLSLSVEELLFFVRLLLEEKVMDVGALKPIFLFLSRHARTTGSDTLSYESLRKKYSRVQLGAKKRVAVLLDVLAKRAEQHTEG